MFCQFDNFLSVKLPLREYVESQLLLLPSLYTNRNLLLYVGAKKTKKKKSMQLVRFLTGNFSALFQLFIWIYMYSFRAFLHALQLVKHWFLEVIP